MDNSEDLHHYEQILKLATDERKLVSIDSKTQQFSAIKTYLWLNVTFIASIAWLFDYAKGHEANFTLAFGGCLLPTIAGALLGIVGLSQSILRVTTHAPVDSYSNVANLMQERTATSKKIELVGFLIDNYQLVLNEQRTLISRRARLLKWQCTCAVISFLSITATAGFILYKTM